VNEMNKLEKIKKYAESIKFKCKNRIELTKKVAKKFNISPATANNYLTLLGFKFKPTIFGFRFQEKDEPPKIFQFIADIIREPKFSFELDYNSLYYYKKCVELNIPIRRCIFYVNKDEKQKGFPKGKNPKIVIYYLEPQNEIAYRKILDYFKICDKRLLFLKKALGIGG
jgi:hypothetical protein